MGTSAGPGSPVDFNCPRWRAYWASYRKLPVGAQYDLRGHIVERTGRTRKYKSRRGSALGVRSDTTSREYVCSCGHKGWSNHKELALLPLQEGAE